MDHQNDLVNNEEEYDENEEALLPHENHDH